MHRVIIPNVQGLERPLSLPLSRSLALSLFREIHDRVAPLRMGATHAGLDSQVLSDFSIICCV